MFSVRFFNLRAFASRYFPKVGAAASGTVLGGITILVPARPRTINVPFYQRTLAVPPIQRTIRVPAMVGRL